MNIPCTFRTAGSLVSFERGDRKKTPHTTTVLLCISVAGICRENVLPMLLAITSLEFSSVNVNPLTSQPIKPLVVLQLKVEVDPSVVLTDVGVLTKAEIGMILKITVLCIYTRFAAIIIR